MKEKKEKSLLQFLKDTKKGKYANVEKSSQKFKRMEYKDLTPEKPVQTKLT